MMKAANKRERWIWVGGWGLSPEWLRKEAARAFPSGEHTAVAPTRDAVDRIKWHDFDRAGGYSLGAFLLLKNAERIPRPALLAAPFFAWVYEAELGGRIRRAQIRYLERWLTREPCAALHDFYQRAGLGLERPDRLPYPLDDLKWGLQQLREEQAPPRLPGNWRGIIGAADPLLDAGVILTSEPRLEVVEGGHHPAALLKAAVEANK